MELQQLLPPRPGYNDPNLRAEWLARLGSYPEGLKARLLERDRAMVAHLAEEYKVPRYRLHHLAEEVAEWRVEEVRMEAESRKLEWSKKSPSQEFMARQDAHTENTRRLFGLQPRIFHLEFSAAASHLVVLRQAEDDAQRQNQGQLRVELRREMDKTLDDLLKNGWTMEAIHRKLLEIGWTEEKIEELKNG